MSGFRTIVVAALAATFLLAVSDIPAIAGNYHDGPSLLCSDCHITHASLSHDESGQPASGAQPPSKYLAKRSSAAELCLACHDEQIGIPDVSGVDVNNPSEQYDGSERAGGHFAEDGADSYKGHNLAGRGEATSVECTACHDPHGNANYRNLKTIGDDPEQGPLAYVDPAATGLDKYRRSSIGYVKNFGDKLCGQCHDLGSAESTLSTSGRYMRHPSTSEDLLITLSANAGHSDPQHWVSGEGSGFEVGGSSVPRVPFAVGTADNYAAAASVSADNEVFCLSCHKAHGSAHAFGMIWPYGTRDALASASGCNQCHNVSQA